MLVLITGIAYLIVGWELAALPWRRSPEAAPEGVERAAAAITIAFTMWIALDWALALGGTLTRPMLLARTVVLMLAALAILVRRARTIRLGSRDVLALLVPLALWTLFILWRGAIVPVVTHDALSHHLPRAVIYARAHAFVDLSKVNPVFDDVPVNYELLLADIIQMTGGDESTEWLSTIVYLCFVAAAGALASRWWRDRRITLLCMILTAAIPIALLHSGTHKNDLLVSLFMLLSLVWFGRWMRGGDFPSLLLLAATVAMAVGTKPQGGILGLVLLPWVAWRMLRELRGRRLALALFAGIAAFVFLGGYTYLDNYLARGAGGLAQPAKFATPVHRYDDWANLWQAPWVLAYAPFSPNAYWLWVPWEHEPWFWKRYEIFFSHLGVPFALAFLGAPFAIAAWRDDERRGERLLAFGAMLATLLLMLPVYFPPHGTYLISLPRYAAFIAPLFFAWSGGALFTTLQRTTARAAKLLRAFAVGFFALYAIDFAMHDTFAPLDYVLWAREHPGTRFIPFDPYRATSQLDKFAGPDDLVALDVSWGSWVYPAFGPRLTRPVYFITHGDGPIRLPPETKWVVVERAFLVTWGSTEMKTLANARKYFNTRPPEEWETRVTRVLKRDSRFVLVGEDEKRNQAIFRRVR